MEKRNFNKMDSGELPVGFSQQDSNSSDSVLYVSRFDVCLAGLPKKILSNESKLSIIVTGHGENLRMHIRPRWSMLDGWQ